MHEGGAVSEDRFGRKAGRLMKPRLVFELVPACLLFLL
jgi:hypothetical protein